MRPSIVPAAAALLLTISFVSAKDKNPHARFRVVGILVNSETELPSPSDKESKQEAFLGQRVGTTLAVVLSGIKGGIIELDRKKSKVTKFSDSEGTDLLVKEKFGGPFEMGSTTSGDKTRLLFRVRSPKVPKEGSESIRLEGHVAIKVSQNIATVTSKKRAKLSVGSKVTVGPFSYKVSRAGKPQFGGGGYEIEFESTDDLSGLHSLRFLDPRGKQIPSKATGSSSMTFGEKTTSMSTYLLEKKLSSAKIEIKHWKDLKTVEVPFKVEARVGL